MKILVSACLLGEPVRYDGQGKLLADPVLSRWQRQGRLVCCCPETAGGLAVPRPPAELVSGDGNEVLQGNGEVHTENGRDVTEAFTRGAYAALALARKYRIRLALLKANSPSCANDWIYDGNFNGVLTRGQGVTAALLRQHGIAVFNETQLPQLERALFDLEHKQKS